MDNLPSSALTHIASFLAVPSRALFAVALSVTSEESLAIVGTQWDILDFGRIHKDLAAKLTDDHIRDILLSVNAVNRVKRLILSGCVNITGAGLEPLRGSLVIEQIDLGLVGDDESPALGAELPISCNHVLPILDSIIEQERCALKHLHFPNAWRGERSILSDFHQFILRYNQMWARRQEVLCCSKCSASLPQRWERNEGGTWVIVHDVGGPWIRTDADDDDYGTHRYTCHGCLENYCLNDESYHAMMYTCKECYRVYCDDCEPMRSCERCYNTFCSDCDAQKLKRCRDCDMLLCDEDRKTCYSCGVPWCGSCGYGDSSCYTCDQCDKTSCADCSPVLRCAHDDCEWQCCGGCAEDLFPWADQSCPDCGNFYCDDHMAFCSTCDDDGACCNKCRVKRTLEGRGGKRKRYGGTCGKCCQLLVPLLKEHVEELTNDINQLKGEIKSLRKNEGNSDQEGGD